MFHDAGNTEEPLTAGAVIAAAEEAMAGTRPVNWRQRLSAVSPDLFEAMAHDAREATAQSEAAAKLADDSAYQARLEDAKRAIATGEFGLVDLQKAAGDSGWVRGTADFQRLFGLIAKRAADTLDYDRAVSKYTDPTYQFDPASPEDRQAVDLIYERGIAGNDTGPIDGDPDAIAFLRRVVTRVGIVPDSARQTLEEAIVSGSDVTRSQALVIVDELISGAADDPDAVPAQTSARQGAIGAETGRLIARQGLGGQRKVSDVADHVQKSDPSSDRGADTVSLDGRNATDLFDWRTHFASILSSEFVDLDANAAIAKEMSLLEFANAFKDNGAFDYKHNDKLIESIEVADQNRELLEDFGNFHYGYVAAASGYTLLEALLAAGGYQVFKKFKGQAGGNTRDFTNAFPTWIPQYWGRVLKFIGMSLGARRPPIRQPRYSRCLR